MRFSIHTGLRCTDVPRQHAEFIAAKALDHVRSAYLRDELACHRLEQRVAGRLAVRIIDRLEAVEIDIDQRRVGSIALDIGERALELTLEAASIEYVVQRVEIGTQFEFGDSGVGYSQLALAAQFRHRAGSRAPQRH
jgi:hypothetical protein